MNMKADLFWGYRPYTRPDEKARALLPYIARLAPEKDALELEWFDRGGINTIHILKWRKRGAGKWNELPADAPVLRVEGLAYEHEYEVTVSRQDGTCGDVRLFMTGGAPVDGVTINYLHPEDKQYAFSGRFVCSPSIVRLPSGALLASMDVYENHGCQNLMLIFRSDDRGKTWRYLTDIFPCFWGKLFVHRGRLYLMGCNTENGDIVIGASDDEGETWCAPAHLFRGSGMSIRNGWQMCPSPVIEHRGRIWMAVDFGGWEERGSFTNGLISAPEASDLLDPENWVCTDMTQQQFDADWFKKGAPKNSRPGAMLEPSPVVGLNGEIICVTRIGLVGCEPEYGVGVLLCGDPGEPEKPLSLEGFAQMPSGSNSRSHVIFDKKSGQYIAAGNICVDPKTPAQRNILAIQASSDLLNWHVIKIVIDHRDDDPQNVGFQYPSFIFDHDDLLLVSRTALHGAENYHNANMTTFHVVENFRRYL